MSVSVIFLFFSNLAVNVVVFFYPKAFLQVSTHFMVLLSVVSVLLSKEKAEKKFTLHVLAVIFGAVTGFLLNVFQEYWRGLNELALDILKMTFPGASWLKLLDSWLERLPIVNGYQMGSESFVLAINILFGCLFLWATLRFITLKGKSLVAIAFALACVNTLLVGRLYFTWPPIFWGSLICFGGAALLGWICKERKIKETDLPWVVVVGNLPWCLAGMGVGYRSLFNSKALIDMADARGVGEVGIPVAIVIAVIVLMAWASLLTFIQWLIITGSQHYLFNVGQEETSHK